MSDLLKKATTGKKPKPLNIILYGVEGIGKSTFAQDAPGVIYIGGEENDELEKGHVMPACQTWTEFMSYIDALLNDDHDFKTLCIDTLDSIEILVHKDILDKDKATTISRACGGFGNGLTKASEMFVELRRKLKTLRDEKGMNIILLAHCAKVKQEDPINLITFDTYQIKLDKRVTPLFKDWVSAIIFVNYDNHKTETSSGKEAIVSDGSARMYTRKTPAYEAKNRFDLPEYIPFEKGKSWNLLTAHVKAFYSPKKKETKKDGK